MMPWSLRSFWQEHVGLNKEEHNEIPLTVLRKAPLGGLANGTVFIPFLDSDRVLNQSFHLLSIPNICLEPDYRSTRITSLTHQIVG